MALARLGWEMLVAAEACRGEGFTSFRRVSFLCFEVSIAIVFFGVVIAIGAWGRSQRCFLSSMFDWSFSRKKS